MEDIPVIPSLRFPWKKVLAIGSSIAGGSIVSTGTIIGVTKNSEMQTIQQEHKIEVAREVGVSRTKTGAKSPKNHVRAIERKLACVRGKALPKETLQQTFDRLSSCKK